MINEIVEARAMTPAQSALQLAIYALFVLGGAAIGWMLRGAMKK